MVDGTFVIDRVDKSDVLPRMSRKEAVAYYNAKLGYVKPEDRGKPSGKYDGLHRAIINYQARKVKKSRGRIVNKELRKIKKEIA